MDFSFKTIYNWVSNIIVRPTIFWQMYDKKKEEENNLFSHLFLPLLFITAVAVFFGEFLKSSHFYAQFALLKSLRKIVLFLLQYVIAAYFTNELMKTFGAEKNIKLAKDLVILSFTPVFIVSIITGLFPFLYVIDVLGLYCCYIFWKGVDKLLVFPEKQKQRYVLITILINFFTFSFLSVLLSKFLTAFL